MSTDLSGSHFCASQIGAKHISVLHRSERFTFLCTEDQSRRQYGLEEKSTRLHDARMLGNTFNLQAGLVWKQIANLYVLIFTTV